MPREIKSVRLSLEGAQSSMKTSLALTAPYPSVLFAFDGGYERAIWGKRAELWKGVDIHEVDFDLKTKIGPALWQGHDITIIKLQRPIQTDPIRKRGYRDLWNWFNEGIANAAMDKGNLRSVIVDTMTLARETRADAHLQAYQDNPEPGRPMRTNLTQIEYGVVNTSVQDIFLNFENCGVNLIATHHLTEERKDMPVTQRDGSVKVERQLTGELIIQGMGKTYQFVDVAIRMEMQQDKQTKKASSKATFIGKCGYNPDLLGTSLVDITWNSLFGWIATSLGGNVTFPVSKIGLAE